jgi:hypothetical protein
MLLSVFPQSLKFTKALVSAYEEVTFEFSFLQHSHMSIFQELLYGELNEPSESATVASYSENLVFLMS